MKGIRALHFLKLPSMAIFPLGIDHFISEITICIQQENLPRPNARPDAIPNALPNAAPPLPKRPLPLQHA